MGFTVDHQPQTRLATFYRDVTCDRCDRELPEQSIVSASEHGSLQYDNNLVLHLEGGYGMFCDPDATLYPRPDRPHDPEYTKVLCHECAHELAEWLGIDVHNWHTHAPASGQHADHHDHAGRSDDGDEAATDAPAAGGTSPR